MKTHLSAIHRKLAVSNRTELPHVPGRRLTSFPGREGDLQRLLAALGSRTELAGAVKNPAVSER